MVFNTNPPDLAFTTFVNGPGSPAHLGASDVNRLQNNQIAQFGRPSARVSRSDTQTFPNSFTPTGLYWNMVGIESDPALVDNIGGAVYTDRIHFLYPGEWQVGCILRCQANNTAGNYELFLYKAFTSNPEILIDADTGLCSATIPTVLRAGGQTIIVSAADVTNGAGLRAEFVQDSGGNAAVMGGAFAFPQMWARWVGNAA